MRVLIDWTPIVELDRLLYGYDDKRFSTLRRQLERDPFLGQSTDRIHFEYLSEDLTVHYLVQVYPDGVLVLLTGIRPPEVVSRSKVVLKIAGQIAALVRDMKGLLGLFGGKD